MMFRWFKNSWPKKRQSLLKLNWPARFLRVIWLQLRAAMERPRPRLWLKKWLPRAIRTRPPMQAISACHSARLLKRWEPMIRSSRSCPVFSCWARQRFIPILPLLPIFLPITSTITKIGKTISMPSSTLRATKPRMTTWSSTGIVMNGRQLRDAPMQRLFRSPGLTRAMREPMSKMAWFIGGMKQSWQPRIFDWLDRKTLKMHWQQLPRLSWAAFPMRISLPCWRLFLECVIACST